MKILNKSMKRLVLLSTAAILPMLAITSCSDDDDPPVAADEEVLELPQEEIEMLFIDALEANSDVSIQTQETMTIAGFEIDAGTVLINNLLYTNQNVNVSTVVFDSNIPDGISFTAQYVEPAEITYPANNSGIILKIVLDTINIDHGGPYGIIKMEYLLHYKTTRNESGFYQFELDLNQSYYRLYDRDLYRFGGANILQVPE